MHDLTHILSEIESGDPAAAERLLPLVYEELKNLAAKKMLAERPDHTLQATALVHEAYLRLVGAQQMQHWDSRGHFFAAAAEAMRRILVESARTKRRLRRGGGQVHVAVESLDVAVTAYSDPDLLLDLEDGLVQLIAEDPEVAELLKLRLFAGLSVSQAGEMLGMSRSVAYRNWDYIRSWFAVYDADSSH